MGDLKEETAFESLCSPGRSFQSWNAQTAKALFRFLPKDLRLCRLIMGDWLTDIIWIQVTKCSKSNEFLFSWLSHPGQFGISEFLIHAAAPFPKADILTYHSRENTGVINNRNEGSLPLSYPGRPTSEPTIPGPWNWETYGLRSLLVLLVTPVLSQLRHVKMFAVKTVG